MKSFRGEGDNTNQNRILNERNGEIMKLRREKLKKEEEFKALEEKLEDYRCPVCWNMYHNVRIIHLHIISINTQII